MSNIILIGFMGCGKSSVGRRLSESCNLQFLDTDQLIEKDAGKTISEIFAQEGEKAFRNMETACLEKLLQENTDGVVLSVGGGLPIREENRKLLKKLGNVIFLEASAETVYNRVKYDTTRPLLQGNNPRGRIMDLMRVRKHFYEDGANYIVNVDGKNFEKIIDEIMKLTGNGEE